MAAQQRRWRPGRPWLTALLVADHCRGSMASFASLTSWVRPSSGSDAEAFQGSEHVEVLTVTTFQELVVDVTSAAVDGEAPEYFPLVMFHMPWCEHCRKTLPELESAASSVHNAVQAGQLSDSKAFPKFFTLSCEESGTREICDRQKIRSFPSIVVYREGRAIRFNRPRLAHVIGWWAMRMSRPAVTKIDTREAFDQASSYEIGYLLYAKSKDTAVLDAWEQVALDHMDGFSFMVAHPGSALGKHLAQSGKPPSVHVRGPPDRGLEPLPLEGELTRENLEAWVSFNQFAPVIKLDHRTVHELKQSQLRVVVLVHASGNAGLKARAAFEAKGQELRPSAKFIFATLNATEEAGLEVLRHTIPLCTSDRPHVPRICIFRGEEDGLATYWENPRLTAPEELTLEALEALIDDPWAMQDDGWLSQIKYYRKSYYRFATRSTTSFLLALVIPVTIGSFTMLLCRALFQDDDLPDEKQEKVD